MAGQGRYTWPLPAVPAASVAASSVSASPPASLLTPLININIHAHCKEISIYVFPEKELRGFSPNFHIHASVSDQYISRIGPPIFLEQNRQTDRGDI